MSTKTRERPSKAPPCTGMIHIARPPNYLFAYCGKPRPESEPLKPGSKPDCVVCLDLHRQSGRGLG